VVEGEALSHKVRGFQSRGVVRGCRDQTRRANTGNAFEVATESHRGKEEAEGGNGNKLCGRREAEATERGSNGIEDRPCN